MAQLATPRPSERFATMVTVIIFHAAFFVLLLASRGPPGPTLETSGTLKVLSIKAEAAAPTAPPPPKLPSKIDDETPPQRAFAFADNPDPDALAAPSGGCVTLDVVRNAILADPAAVDSIINAPREARSIADAVVIWNAGWGLSANSRDAPLGPARSAVERTLGEMTPSCLDEPIAGPRLIPIPAGELRTTFLVFGSGQWKWREIMVSAEPAAVEDASEQPGLEDDLRQILDWWKGN